MGWSPVGLPDKIWSVFGCYLTLIEQLEEMAEEERDPRILADVQTQVHFVYLARVRNGIRDLELGWTDCELDEKARDVLKEGRRRKEAELGLIKRKGEEL